MFVAKCRNGASTGELPVVCRVSYVSWLFTPFKRSDAVLSTVSTRIARGQVLPLCSAFTMGCARAYLQCTASSILSFALTAKAAPVAVVLLSLFIGCANANNVGTPDESSAESKHQNATGNKEGRARANPANPGSTLLVPGSLYVGTGLGFKKTPVWVPPGGSAKDKLKNIMEDKTNSCNQASPIIVCDNNEERD